MTSPEEELVLSDPPIPEPSQDSQGMDTTIIQKQLEQHKQNVSPDSTSGLVNAHRLTSWPA